MINKQQKILENLAENWICPFSQLPITAYEIDLINFGNALLEALKEDRKSRIKEPTLFKVELTANGYFGNSLGDILLVKEMDNELNIYYYDDFHRWCYAPPEDYTVVMSVKNMKAYTTIAHDLGCHLK